MKNEQELFSIGEIAKALGVTRRTVLHYEECGLIQPDVRNGMTGYRYYSIDTFTRMRSIRSMQNLGLTLNEIRNYFNDSADLLPLIQRLEKMRDELNLNIEKLYERTKVGTPQIKDVLLPSQTVYRRVYHCESIADRTVRLRETALEAMRLYGTDTTRRMYFTEHASAQPDETAFCVAIPAGSCGEYVKTLPAVRALCLYHHGAYEELSAVRERLLDYAAEHGVTAPVVFRHTYLEGPPQHKDPDKFITQVSLVISPPRGMLNGIFY